MNSAQFLSSPQVADRLGISERSLARLRAEGGGPPFVKIGRRVVYSPAALASWVQQREQPRGGLADDLRQIADALTASDEAEQRRRILADQAEMMQALSDRDADLSDRLLVAVREALANCGVDDRASAEDVETAIGVLATMAIARLLWLSGPAWPQALELFIENVRRTAESGASEEAN